MTWLRRVANLCQVALNDGEAGEATVLAVRAKLYYLEKGVGWKERGSGMLKINVPESCISFEDGNPVPGSFDASGMEGDGDEDEKGSKVVRLIMRQDSTHRMLLNTIVIPAIDFEEKTSLKSVSVIFTAFEGDDGKPVSLQARVSTLPSMDIGHSRTSVKSCVAASIGANIGPR